MNTYIEKIETIPYSLWDGLQISLAQAILLLFFIIGISYWLMERPVKALILGLTSLCCFATLRTLSFLQSEKQQKIIVYNVPQKRAIDILDGRDYFFVGDSSLRSEDFAQNFHLKPSRVAHRVKDVHSIPSLYFEPGHVTFRDKHILLLDEVTTFAKQSERPTIDLLIISKNPKLYIIKMAASLDIKQVVFDGSVPAWKSKYWKIDCDSLRIPWHDVALKGAFVMNLR
jgi:competence protein ComEC